MRNSGGIGGGKSGRLVGVKIRNISPHDIVPNGVYIKPSEKDVARAAARRRMEKATKRAQRKRRR